MIHLDLHGGEEGRPLFSFEGIFWDNTSNSDIQRRLNLGRDGTISSRTVTQGVGVNGIFMDFDRYVEEGLNPEPENTELSSPSTAATRTERVITAVLNLATNPVGTIVGFIGNLFGGGTGGSSNPTPYVKDDDRDNPTKPIPPEPIPSTDLFTTATGATETGRETATSTEYKFAGSITRVIFEAEDGIPVTDINANYADTITTSLSIDYQCDTTVNATSSSRLAYTAFDPIEDTSTVLLSSYVPLTEFGTHCFFITVDTKNKVMEKDEENNTSNVYRFIVDNPI
jgi:hypothetical protein